MKPIKFRSGTNQNDRIKATLQPEYVSIEERSLLDLLKYAKEYANSVRFYDLNNQTNGFWSAFLAYDDEQLAKIAEFAENPAVLEDEPQLRDLYSQPHLTLLLTFLKLLKHPQAQFASLTRKHLDYFYRDILNLEELDEIPDQVHIIFKLARNINESLVKKGVLFNAGKDATGVDLQYEALENLVLNRAEVADIKTIHFNKSTANLKSVHLENDRGDEGFEKILCLVLERTELPPYRNDFGTELAVDASFLRTELYERIKGKERDDLAENDAEYIFEWLSFPYLKDCWTCLDVFYRESNKGYVGVTIPEETEWEGVYDILESVHRERTARVRRKELKAIHKTRGFEAMMMHIFGEPNPGNLLFAMPENINTLEKLADSKTEAARKYVENQLCMTTDDFKVIMQKRNRSLGETAGNEVYRLLERAWTKKRNYQYPTISSEFVEGYYADTIYDSTEHDSIERFETFGKSSAAANSEHIKMGFAVGSPLLLLNEGLRTIEMIISARDGSLNRTEISGLLAEKQDLFQIYLSTQNGWQQAKNTRTEVGKFVIKPPLRTFNEKYARLVCDSLRYDFLNGASIGWFVVFENGQVFEIEAYDYLDNKILLSSVYLTLSTDTTRLITALVPKEFKYPLVGAVTIGKYDHTVVHPQESFSDYHVGKYLVDDEGKIFLIKKFIAADSIEVRYCGTVGQERKTDQMIINRVWETVEPEYAEIGSFSDISDLAISEMFSDDREFRFQVNDRALRIDYPIDPTSALSANDVKAAWDAWNDIPGNDSGRFDVSVEGDGSWRVTSFSKQIELTGETIKRFESAADNGILVTYRGRPTDQVFLVIRERSEENETCCFHIAGGILTITPGRNSYTANQVAADWHLWLAANDPQGFCVESKDTHEWEVFPRLGKEIPRIDQRIKVTEIRNLYGNGIRVTYTGPESDQPRLVLKENEIDLFDFEVVEEQQLVVKYPSINATSAHDLVQEWEAWQNSELNDPGRFEIRQLGDGLWKIEAQQMKEFQSVTNQIMECAIHNVTSGGIDYETGLIAMYRLSGIYQNAFVKLKKALSADVDFHFGFDDALDDGGNLIGKRLTITYPALQISDDQEIQTGYQIRHVQDCLDAWNRLGEKHNFILIRQADDATWTTDPLPDPYEKNFSEDPTYVCTVHPNGFKAKFQPNEITGSLFTGTPNAVIVIEENDPVANIEDDHFSFSVKRDFPDNHIYLFVKYPTTKPRRTVAKLLADWKTAKSKFGNEFSLEQAGTGKWNITAISEITLTSDPTPDTPKSDEALRRFFSYPTVDVNGFTIHYAGPEQIDPEISFIEGTTDDFVIKVASEQSLYDNETFESALTIYYPKRKDKRRLVNLFRAWNQWKKTSQNLEQGFDIIDTTPVVSKREKASLLNTGDRVREFKVGGNNGLCFTYIGHRAAVDVDVASIIDFSDQDIGKSILWENGQIFTITERSDRNTVSIKPAGYIDRFDHILQYQPDAICLNALKYSIEIDPDFPPIVPHPQDQISNQPMCQVLFNTSKNFSEKSSEAIYYETFNSILMETINLKVEVKELRDIKTRGHVAMINPQNAYQPFGNNPDKAARFYFANRELCEKKLDSLNIHLHWKDTDFMTADGVPDMKAHYFAYSHCGLDHAATILNRDFEVDLHFKDRRSWMKLSDTPRHLFQPQLPYEGIDTQTYPGNLFEPDEELPKDPLDWQRYYKLELSDQGFLKEISEATRQAIADASNRLMVAKNEYNTIKQEIESREATLRSSKINEAKASAKGEAYSPPVIPEARPLPALPENDKDLSQLVFNEPYSPFVEWISFDYTASASASFLDNAAEESNLDVPVGFFRYHPFGYSKMGQLSYDEDDYLLPHYEKQGYLNIGVKNIKPGQTLSLLTQMVSGSGVAHLDIPSISWSYLAANKWKSFEESHVLLDKTYGLQDTGIIRFSIPEDATLDNTVMPTDRCWIRAEAGKNITAVPDIIDIRTQAILVQYVNKNNDPDRLESPLGADTIKALVERDSNIKDVEQPYSSFKGKKKEVSGQFYARISERLQHKHRALTLRDYENLILAKFSEIYKIKCLPQGELKILNNGSEGEVIIVVILKNRNATPFFPLKPKTPANILKDIENYIRNFMPPLVTVKVVNPRFEEIQYRLAVKFTENYDFGFYINQLNEDIKQFLSPWAYSKNVEISFGSSVFSSSIINHIENTEYVDYVANFTLLRQTITHEEYTEVIPLFLTKDNAATTKYPDSILVSAEHHIIDVIHTDLYDASAFRGIGHMKIGTDFWISRPGPIFSVGVGDMELEQWPVPRYAFHSVAVTVNVNGIVDGSSVNKDFSTTFSRKDSQKLWDLLNGEEYIDAKGNVLAVDSLYDDLVPFEIDGELFADYLENHKTEFDFDLELTANDFAENPAEDVAFSYDIATVHDRDIIQSNVKDMLKAAIGFAGLSQYPFIVY